MNGERRGGTKPGREGRVDLASFFGLFLKS
jgi:hypothetical protein